MSMLGAPTVDVQLLYYYHSKSHNVANSIIELAHNADATSDEAN